MCSLGDLDIGIDVEGDEDVAVFSFGEVPVTINGQERQYKVVDHPGGAGVLAIQGGKVLLVEQFRPAVARNVLEIPAGMRENKEDPLLCAQREFQEETGFQARRWYSLGSMLVSPGYTSEELYLFLAEDLVPGDQDLDDTEDIALHWRDLETVRRQVSDGTLTDSKTIVALQRYWLEMWIPVESVVSS